MNVPKIEKVVINVGIGKSLDNKEYLNLVLGELVKITGQVAQVTKAKKAISAFKLKKGVPVGCKVTLRHKKMDDFLFKLINAVLPRIRDFRGISEKNFDNSGNLNIGIREYTIFPEIHFDNVKQNIGLGINIYTSCQNKEKAKKLLEAYGLIFEKGED